MTSKSTVPVILALLTAMGCGHHAAVTPTPVDVPTDPCPTKETYSPSSDNAPELIRIGSLGLSDQLKQELKGARAVVSTLIDGRGRPVACTVTIVESTDPRLNGPARAAVIAARYRPATLGGLPVPTWLVQPVEVR